MSDRMLIVGKDGRARYLIEFNESAVITDALNCNHEFDDEDSPCIHCNLYPDEISSFKKE